MPIEELLEVLSALRIADIRLASTPPRSPERAAVMREIRRLERRAFVDGRDPDAVSVARRWSAGVRSL